MQIPFKHISATLLIAAAVMLIGCTSSSDSTPAVAAAPVYSGNTTPAALTVANAEDVDVTATEAANEAISANKGNTANPFGVSIVDNASLSEKLTSITRTLLDAAIATNMPVGITLTADDLGGTAAGFCGGSVTIPDSAFTSGLLNGSFTYNNLCYDDGISGQITINGTVVFEETSTTITMTYVNFTVTSAGSTESFNATITCDTSFYSCTFSSTFVGSDGNVHSVEGFTVTGDDTYGYYVSATFFHHTYGETMISTTSALTFGSCGIYPDGGELSITSTNGSYTSIVFNSDCTYAITGYNGTSSFGPIAGSWL